jgi:large conductance mechanosensitive channel
MRGNVVDLAIAVVIGGAFNSVVSALVRDLVTPLIGAIGGEPDFSKVYFTINNSRFMVGDFINAIISFLIVSSVIYFLVVMPINKLMDRLKRGEKKDPTEKMCPECLSIIPLKATRCKFCTAVLKV